MNRKEIQKLVGSVVQLVPIAHSIDASGRLREPINDDWRIDSATNRGVRIINLRTSHVTELGFDHIHEFNSNPDRSIDGARCGFLTLKTQISMKGESLTFIPNARPGEPVAAVVVTKKSGLLGDGLNTSIVVNHNLGSRAVTTGLYQTAAPHCQVDTDVEHTTIDSVTFIFAIAPGVNEFSYVIQAN